MTLYIIDPQVIDELRGLSDANNPLFLWDQVSLFTRRGQDLVDDLARAAQALQFDDLARAAHALAGSASVVGAVRLRSVCMKLEENARFDRAVGVIGLLSARVQDEFLRAERELTDLAHGSLVHVNPA